MNHTDLILVGAFVFSGAMSTMPAIPENAPWIARWAHDFFQFLGANLNRVGQRLPNPTKAAQ